jgi:Tfp pilus assembly protein PilX
MNPFSRQSGFVLFMTLMILVLMSIAGLALMRAVDSSSLVADNIAYKQAAIITSDTAIKAATDWLAANPLTADDTSNAAYASDTISIDWTGTATALTTDKVDWENNSSAPIKAKQVTSLLTPGYSAYYVIHKLCETGTNPVCATSDSSTSSGSTKSGSSYGHQASSTSLLHYYRITVKVIGPKHTVSYSQVFVLI